MNKPRYENPFEDDIFLGNVDKYDIYISEEHGMYVFRFADGKPIGRGSHELSCSFSNGLGNPQVSNNMYLKAKTLALLRGIKHE